MRFFLLRNNPILYLIRFSKLNKSLAHKTNQVFEAKDHCHYSVSLLYVD